MAEITLTDGLCRVSFDSSTVEGLEIIDASPAVVYFKSNQEDFSSIRLEYLGIDEIFTENELSDRGLRHVLRLLRDLKASNWTYKGIDAAGRFAKGPSWIVSDMEWHYVLMTDDGSEAICAFCRIDDDHICSVSAIFQEGDEIKLPKIANLIESVRVHND
jgi:hypothetical protein